MAAKANIFVDQGSTFSTYLELSDENGNITDLSGYSVEGQIRKWYTSSNAVTFSTSVNSDFGTITLSLTSSQTNNMVAGRYVYDVEITEISTNAISRVVEGIVTVTPGVTR